MYKKLKTAAICTLLVCFSFVGKAFCLQNTNSGDEIELLPQNRTNSVNTPKLFLKSPYEEKQSAITGQDLPYTIVQEDFEITKEDIKNAIPTQADVILSKKNEHDIKVMENRHFEKVNDYDTPKYRIAKLENYLLGRTWEFSPLEDRMRRLRLASQRKMLSGTSLPTGIRQYVSPSRIANDSTPIYENDDNVGLIDGFMRLYAPDVYEKWSFRKKRLRKRYNDG